MTPQASKAPVARGRHFGLPSGALIGPIPLDSGELLYHAPSQSGDDRHLITMNAETREARCSCWPHRLLYGSASMASLEEPMRLCPHLETWREPLLRDAREHRGELPGLEEL